MEPSKGRQKTMTSEAFEEFVIRVGGAEALAQRIQAHESLARKLDSERPHLLADYPDQWVAMGADGVAANADTLQSLLAKLTEKGVSEGEVYHEYIDAEPVTYLL